LRKSFEYRKAWVERKIAELAEVFACSILSYAVMSNRFHLVVSILPAKTNAWNAYKVAERWCGLFPQKKPEKHQAKIEAIAANAANVAVYRQRLHDLSWLMRIISEPIAQRANAEDKTNRRFWRFEPKFWRRWRQAAQTPEARRRGPGCLVNAGRANLTTASARNGFE